MRVMKFGALAVADAARLRNLVQIVGASRESDPALVVVCTALPDITDKLIGAARTAAHADEATIEAVRRELWSRHRALAERTVPDDWERESLFQEWAALLKVYDRFTRSIATLGEPSPRGIDAVASLGERFVSHLVAVALRQGGVPAREIDASEIIVTDDRYGAARPHPTESAERIRARLAPLGQSGIVPVVTGYIGATPEGVVTTLGRGGGDYTAALIGAALKADEVSLWTDVSGILTADPKLVPEAQTLAELSYAEAEEIARFGPEVLHLRTIRPVAEQNVTLTIRNVLRPDQPGTRIIAEARPTATGARAIISATDLSVLTVAGSDAWSPEVAARALVRLAEAGIEVLTFTESFSEHSLTLAVRRADAAFTRECLTEILEEGPDGGRERPNPAVTAAGMVAVISARDGNDMAPHILAAMSRARAHVLGITRGVSSHNYSLLLPESEVGDAVRALHRELRLG